MSARRPRHCCCFALCVVRCPTWFQPAARGFYGHLVSSSSGIDCVCAGALHPVYARARCSGVMHVGCATRRFRSAAARCAVESPAVVHRDTSPARASRRVRLRAALCAIGTALRHCRSDGDARRVGGAASRRDWVVTGRQPPRRTHALAAGALFDSPPTRETCAQVRGEARGCAAWARAGERTVPEPCPVSSCAHLGLRSDPAAADGLRREALWAGVTHVLGACAAACGVR